MTPPAYSPVRMVRVDIDYDTRDVVIAYERSPMVPCPECDGTENPDPVGIDILGGIEYEPQCPCCADSPVPGMVVALHDVPVCDETGETAKRGACLTHGGDNCLGRLVTERMTSERYEEVVRLGLRVLSCDDEGEADEVKPSEAAFALAIAEATP